jgi:hypothetical protein
MEYSTCGSCAYTERFAAKGILSLQGTYQTVSFIHLVSVAVILMFGIAHSVSLTIPCHRIHALNVFYQTRDMLGSVTLRARPRLAQREGVKMKGGYMRQTRHSYNDGIRDVQEERLRDVSETEFGECPFFVSSTF